jgi:mRNA-degrading endonuclease RelE of RelBE toxin-antitoxin system
VKPCQDIIFFPKAVRDLEKLDQRYVRQILSDLELLRNVPWPPGKIKKLRGTILWEAKTGDYRSLLFLEEEKAIVTRVVNRRDLDAAIDRLDIAYVLKWLREQ